MVDLEKDTRRWWFSPRSWLCRSMSAWMASSTEPIWISAIFRSFWKNLNPLTMPPLLEKRILRSSSEMEGLWGDSRPQGRGLCALSGAHKQDCILIVLESQATPHSACKTLPAAPRTPLRSRSVPGGGGAASTGSTYGILDRCRVAEGGKMFWKFLEPGFLKRCSGELP